MFYLWNCFEEIFYRTPKKSIFYMQIVFFMSKHETHVLFRTIFSRVNNKRFFFHSGSPLKQAQFSSLKNKTNSTQWMDTLKTHSHENAWLWPMGIKDLWPWAHLEAIAISDWFVAWLDICAVAQTLHIYKKPIQTPNKLRTIEGGEISAAIKGTVPEVIRYLSFLLRGALTIN